MPSDRLSFWIAGCLDGKSPLTPSGTLALCDSFVLVGSLAVHFTVTEQNLGKTEAVRRYLAELVVQWMRKAPG